MSEVTRLLSQIDSGDPSAAEELLPLIYNELRKLAAAKLAHENPGQTLQATALVHEAYLRLVGGSSAATSWESRGHFFSAAAEAMRRILVESARRKGRLKRGGQHIRHDANQLEIAAPATPPNILALDEALGRFEQTNHVAAMLVKLRYFSGLTLKQAAESLGISSRKADQLWAYARSWLLAEMGESDRDEG